MAARCGRWFRNNGAARVRTTLTVSNSATRTRENASATVCPFPTRLRRDPTTTCFGTLRKERGYECRLEIYRGGCARPHQRTCLDHLSFLCRTASQEQAETLHASESRHRRLVVPAMRNPRLCP